MWVKLLSKSNFLLKKAAFEKYDKKKQENMAKNGKN